MTQDNQQDSFDQMLEAGAHAVRTVGDAAGKAIASFDFNAAATTLSNTMQNVTNQLSTLRVQPEKSPYIKAQSSGRMQGLGMVVTGGILGAAALGGLIITAVLAPVALPFAGITGLVSAGCAAGGIALGVQGSSTRGVAETAERISRVISNRVVIPLSELADESGIPLSQLRGQLQKSIAKGYIPQGRIAFVNGEETLFLTNGAYEDFEQYQARTRQQAQAAAAAEQEVARLPQKARDVIAACEDFARRMVAASACITNVDTRERMATLTEKVARVSNRARTHPENAPRFNRYISYYLPTMAKLAEAYAELDATQATGETADKTRREVDDMLDLVATATDNLLDDMLLDQQMDVASDASVMRTMLNQDGLMD